MKPTEEFILRQPQSYQAMMLHVLAVVEQELPQSELLFKWGIPYVYFKNKPFCYFAPNHKRTKPWRFRVFRGEEKLNLGKELQRLYKEITPEQLFLQKKFEDIGDKFSKSNVVLTVSVNFSGLVPEWEEIAATAMAVQNMHLTCAANNVGAYWGTPGMKDYLGEFLHLEENQKCYGLFFMGMIQN